MGFSDKLREGLGAEGARVEINASEGPIPRGNNLAATVTIVAAGKTAEVEALMIRLIEARRNWKDDDGDAVSEEDALALEDRRHLEAGWERTTIGEKRVSVKRAVDANGRYDVEIDIEVPADCSASSAGCTHTLFVQADVKGQIDPTGNVKVTVD